ANIQSAVTSVQKNFGVPDIVGTMPVDALNVPLGATVAQKAYALSLATISQYQSGQPAGASLAGGLQAIQKCLGAPATGCGTGTANIGSLLNTAAAAFVASQPSFSSMPSPVASFGTDFISQGGLTWSPPPIGADVFTSNTFTDYASAAATCSSAKFNGLSGWRLPTITELSSLYASGLMNGKAIYLWSSTPTSKGDANFPGFLGLFFADSQNPKQQPPIRAGSVVSSAPDDKGWVTCVR
ncbi:MAG: hypothetical protein H7322_12115, partial [Ramlibacter sp.]|nr:hypothetical protein [Ramlibacter sp.]